MLSYLCAEDDAGFNYGESEDDNANDGEKRVLTVDEAIETAGKVH